MAIRLEDEYTNSNAADTQYPGGSFKNRSVQGIYDGTPLEQKWANDFLGFFWRLLVVAGITPSGSPDTSLDSDYYDALLEIITDALGTHSALTIAHSATATPTANRMAAYDSGGRLGTNAPVDSNDCSRKLDLDTHAALTAAHSATSTPTANRMTSYDSGGKLSTNAPVDNNDCSRKLDLDTHSALTAAHSATATPTANRMTSYDSGGKLSTNAPVDSNDCSRKLDLDTHAALTSAHSATATPTANRMAAYDSGGRLGTNAPVDDNDCVQYGQFGRSLSANGYQRLPGGLIIQWGLVNIPTSNITITLPIAFPTAGRSIVASLSSVAGLHSPQAYFVGNSQAFFDLYGTNAETAYYIAIGY